MLAWSQVIIIFEVPPRGSFREVKNKKVIYMLFEEYKNSFRGIYYEQCRELLSINPVLNDQAQTQC